MKFKHGTRRRALEYEKDWVQRWKQDGTFEKSVEQRPKDDAYVFYDGPPFITGVPHHGNLLSSIVKDAIPRYQTMKGRRVERVWGWDTHGLPAENFVEKQLNIVDRRQIVTNPDEKAPLDKDGNELPTIPLEKYITKARESMVANAATWENVVDRIGRWVDFKGAYKTMDKDYMESVWWAFKQLYEKGKIYEGEKVLMYDTKFATPVSKNEVTMDNDAYQTVTDPSVFVKFKLKSGYKKDIAISRDSRVLFVCYANVARSQMAKAVFNYLTGTQNAQSAGVGVKDVHPEGTTIGKRNIIVAKEIGKDTYESSGEGVLRDSYNIDITDWPRTQLTQRMLSEYDLVVNIAEEFQTPDWLRGENVVWWDIKDPGLVKDGVERAEASKNAILKIESRIKGLLNGDVIDDDIDSKSYLLAWTTTPWTLPGNTALAVNKDFDYVEVELDGEKLIVAKDLAPKVFIDDKKQPLEYKILRELKGGELVGLEYEPLFEQKIQNRQDVSHDAKVLFVCHGCVGRSQIAKAFYNHYTKTMDAEAAGTDVSHLNPDAPTVRAWEIKNNRKSSANELMEELGLSTLDSERHQLTREMLVGYDLVVNIATKEQTPDWFAGDNVVWWDIEDPGFDHTKDDIRATRDEIDYRIKELISGHLIDDSQDFSNNENRIHGSNHKLFSGYPDENAHKVWSADYVSAENGTGIVHIAPAYGEDDFELAKANNIPVVHTLDDNGYYFPEVAEKLYGLMPWLDSTKPLEVWESNKDIAKGLKKAGIVWKVEYIQHEYPFNPRSKQRIMYRAIPSWFFDIQGSKPLMLEQNENVNWFPEHLKHGRFAKNIEQAPDWNLSRDRFWATAMPVWKGDKGTVKVVGSYAELKELSGVELDDYHRPWVDDITFDIDGEHFTRVDKVLDCWFESGSMPFAQLHYPFENKEKFEKNYPADFIVEYVPQVRAWFYYVHAVNTALFGENAFKNVITTGTLAGNDGRKMSKSLGNYTDPNELMDKYSADSLRFLLMSSPVLNGEDFSLQDKDVQDVARKLSMIWNMYDFFTMYAEVDGWEFDPEKPLGLSVSDRAQDSLKFTPELTELVKSGEKTMTFRYGAKNLKIGDIAQFITRFDENNTEAFGFAQIKSVQTMKLVDIPINLDGHEPYSSKEQQLKAYREYYGAEVMLDSEFTIYEFEFLGDRVSGNFLTNPLDIWIVSRLHQLNQQITENMDAYNLPDALAPILPFIDDASNWFVRRSRRRFWKSEDDGDKNDAYRTLHYVLLKLSVILAPFTPFLAEELYQKMGGGNESVHLLDWPTNYEIDQQVLSKMERTRDVITQGLSARATAGIKVRQPLNFLTYSGEDLGKLDDFYETIIKEEVNVKTLVWASDVDNHVTIDENITPELKREGLMREVIRFVQSARKNAGLNVDDRIILSLKTEDSELQQAIDEHQQIILAETLATLGSTKANEQIVMADGVGLTISIDRR